MTERDIYIYIERYKDISEGYIFLTLEFTLLLKHLSVDNECKCQTIIIFNISLS